MSLIEKILRRFSHVRINDEKKLFIEEILRTLINDGAENLRIVVDFDFTMTMYEKNGEILPSTYAVVEKDEEVKLSDGSTIKEETDRLRAKYHPIEYDPKLSIEEKKPLMVEWWCAVQDLLVTSNFNRKILRHAVENSSMELRTGARTFVANSLEKKVPLLIFSAGLGDVIKVFLEKSIPEFSENPQLTHLISNLMVFDEKDNLIDFNKNLIHSFNKNEQILTDPDYQRKIEKRPNVILLGDTIGDAAMIDRIENSTNVLKIAFLNRSSTEKIEIYQKFYDLIVADDETFDVPNFILNEIFHR